MAFQLQDRPEEDPYYQLSILFCLLWGERRLYTQNAITAIIIFIIIVIIIIFIIIIGIILLLVLLLLVLYYCNWKVWWLLLGLLALRPSVLSLLQTATAFFFGSGTRIITKCDRTRMSSNMFWFFLVEIFVKHLSSIRFHSLRITKMIFDFSGIVDWWWIYNDRFTVFFCVKFERAFAGFGDVDFEIR